MKKFISDKKGIITWFGRIVFLLYVVSNKDFLRQEYIDKLKSILKNRNKEVAITSLLLSVYQKTKTLLYTHPP